MTEWIESCPRCSHRFSDWFVWSNGMRFCFPCWFLPQRTRLPKALVLEDGRVAGEGEEPAP